MMSNDQMMPPQQGPLPGAGANMPAAPGAPPAQPQPYRQLKVEDALAYLDQVKMKFEKQPHIYNKARRLRFALTSTVPAHYGPVRVRPATRPPCCAPRLHPCESPCSPAQAP